MRVTRLDNFPASGSDEQYVSYLEAELLRCRELLSNHFHSRVTLPPSPTLEVQTSQFEISQFNPLTISPPKKAPKKVPQWLPELEKFLNGIPHGVSWVERRQSLGLTSPGRMVYVLAMLLNARIPDRTFAAQDPSPDGLLASLSPLLRPAYSFAISSKHAQTLANLASNVSRFRNLLLASYCQVLVKVEAPQRDVDRIMSLCLGEKSLERYRLGALWVNRRISKLFSYGWKHRASELFLICAYPLPQYGRFSDSSKSSAECFENYLNSEKYTSKYTEVPELIPLSIPCMIKFIAGDSLSLDQICNYLGYDSELLRIYKQLLPKYMDFLAPQSSGGIPLTSEDYQELEYDCDTLRDRSSMSGHESDANASDTHSTTNDGIRNIPGWSPPPSWRDQALWDDTLSNPSQSFNPFS